MAPVVFLPEAENDVAEAHAYYESKQVGVGDRFVDALQELVDGIRSNPQLCGVIRGDIRATPMRGFPYVVYYRYRGPDLLIIAVQHGSRSSRAWRGRA